MSLTTTPLYALAVTAMALVASAPVIAAPPGPNADVKDKRLYVVSGAPLRYTSALVSRVYTKAREPLEVKGRGKCGKRLCPVAFNGVELWAMRSRLDEARPAGPVATQRTLRLGDDGSDVKAAQEALVRAGYKVRVSGKFAQDTEKAIKEMQIANKLLPDGEIGATMRALLKL
jgi:hypothetical protein